MVVVMCCYIFTELAHWPIRSSSRDVHPCVVICRLLRVGPFPCHSPRGEKEVPGPGSKGASHRGISTLNLNAALAQGSYFVFLLRII